MISRAEQVARLEHHAEVLHQLATKNSHIAGIADLAEEATGILQSARAGVSSQEAAQLVVEVARVRARWREEAQAAASLPGAARDGRPPPMAENLISLEEAGRRLPKPDGTPRSVRTIQDWIRKGRIPAEAVVQFSPHVRFLNWPVLEAGKSVTIGGEGADAPDADTEE